MALLATYLQDHLGAATAGVELARRSAGSNRGTEIGERLGRLAGDIEDDRAALRRVMADLGVGPDRLKVTAGWVGEKLGRLKPNGRLLGYSPLSRVVELELLTAAVAGKLALWRTLRELADRDDRLDAAALTRLAARAEKQLGTLDALRRSAAALAFA